MNDGSEAASALTPASVKKSGMSRASSAGSGSSPPPKTKGGAEVLVRAQELEAKLVLSEESQAGRWGG